MSVLFFFITNGNTAMANKYNDKKNTNIINCHPTNNPIVAANIA